MPFEGDEFCFFVLIQRNIAVHETKTENLDRDEEEINSELCVCVCVCVSLTDRNRRIRNSKFAYVRLNIGWLHDDSLACWKITVECQIYVNEQK